jgi:hypothetical protein
MSRRNKSSGDDRGRSDVSPDDLCAPAFDLFDYDRPPSPAPRARRTKHGLADWIVTDDWPEHIPVSEAEVDVFERWFGDFFDELFRTKP